MKIRPMRGQVVVREVAASPSSVLWTPEMRAREVRTHTGRVLAMGPPARTAGGVEVAPGFSVGDLIQWHFTSNEANATRVWEDGEPAVWVPQVNVDGVWFEGDTLRSAAPAPRYIEDDFVADLDAVYEEASR